ncbi:MAG: hypothetical protein ACRDJV_04980 [Actinomycetota bacterium]
MYFFTAGCHKMFGCLHSPAHSPRLGVVFCSSLHSEFVKNYRREVLAARALAEHGIAVQRFHYCGTGNSYGDSTAVSFDTLQSDTLDAVEELRGRTGVAHIGFLGVKWGGLVAAAASCQFPGAPLVLWEPTLQAKQIFRDAIRARAIHALSEGQTGSAADPLVDELDRVGFIEVLGYEMHRAFFESARERSLLAEIGNTVHPMLIVQLQGRQLRSDVGRFVAVLEELGNRVETKVVPLRESWWFAGERWEADEVRPETQGLIETTVSWLERQLSSFATDGSKRT